MAPFRRSSLLPLWLLLTASCAAAAMPPTKVSERLVMPPTPGYVALTESVNPNGSRVMQMVPTHQSAQNWTDMLSIHQVLDPSGQVPAPRQFLAPIEAGWLKACPGSTSTWLREGEEDGHRFALLMLTCPNNPATGKPEHAWLKGLQGAYSHYVVQKAFRYVPQREQTLEWMAWLRGTGLCRPRADGQCQTSVSATPAR